MLGLEERRIVKEDNIGYLKGHLRSMVDKCYEGGFEIFFGLSDQDIQWIVGSVLDEIRSDYEREGRL